METELVNRLQEKLKEYEVKCEHQARVIRVYGTKLRSMAVDTERLISETPRNRDPVLHREQGSFGCGSCI